jgi:hypothetical protein
MKKARVSIIKNNIEEGIRVPTFTKDCEVGQWIDEKMAEKGHNVDRSGLVDMPDYKMDNKSRKRGSNANHTLGSMTDPNIANTENWEDTRFFHKAQNQNQVLWDPDFMEITKTTIIDMDIDLIQENFKRAYNNLRNKLIAEQKAGVRSKELKSDCGWAVFDGYAHHNSYRMRITNKAMKQIYNIAGARDTFKQHFEIEE